jgi:hypothetical protein
MPYVCDIKTEENVFVSGFNININENYNYCKYTRAIWKVTYGELLTKEEMRTSVPFSQIAQYHLRRQLSSQVTRVAKIVRF